jgi:CBS domain-containing protein
VAATSAARQGLAAHFAWIEGREGLASRIILDELLPAAQVALADRGIDSADIDRYLGTLTERVESGKSGSQWLLDSYTATRDQGTRAERLASLVAATVSRQREGTPVHDWPLASIDETGGSHGHFMQVGQFMTTDLFTVNADELVDLAASMMDWRKIRHVPLEDAQHHLVGLVTHRTILRLVDRDPGALHGKSVPVSEIMERNLITCAPSTTTLEAINLMRLHKVGCLPVVDHGKLVGIVTERDFMNVAGQLLEAVMQGRAAEVRPRPGEYAREGTDD